MEEKLKWNTESLQLESCTQNAKFQKTTLLFFFQLGAWKKNEEHPNPQFDGKKLKYGFAFLVETAKPKPKEAKT